MSHPAVRVAHRAPASLRPEREGVRTRDDAVQVDFLFDAYEAIKGDEPLSFLELGAGPAQHSLEMAESQLDVFCVERCAAMVAYSRQLAAADDLDVTYVQADMRDFALPVRALALLCTAPVHKVPLEDGGAGGINLSRTDVRAAVQLRPRAGRGPASLNDAVNIAHMRACIAPLLCPPPPPFPLTWRPGAPSGYALSHGLWGTVVARSPQHVPDRRVRIAVRATW